MPRCLATTTEWLFGDHDRVHARQIGLGPHQNRQYHSGRVQGLLNGIKRYIHDALTY